MSKAFDPLRHLVSQEKKRIHEDGFDLDLSYITPKIIAMGFPAEKIEGIYRNQLSKVKKFLDGKHQNSYKLFNLCAERHYEHSKFDGRVEEFGFEDHNAPPFELIARCCGTIDAFIKENENNVAIIHCKAGKGRTGLIICCWLLHAKVCSTANEALRFFAEKRTDDGKGVTIPSQIRYVRYYEQALAHPVTQFPSKRLVAIKMHTIPHFDVGGGCDPFMKITNHAGDLLHESKPLEHASEKTANVTLDAGNTELKGDFKISLYDKDPVKNDHMCHFWLNTAFIPGNVLSLTKTEIDKAVKDKKCDHFKPNFSVELFFQ